MVQYNQLSKNFLERAWEAFAEKQRLKIERITQELGREAYGGGLVTRGAHGSLGPSPF